MSIDYILLSAGLMTFLLGPPYITLACRCNLHFISDTRYRKTSVPFVFRVLILLRICLLVAKFDERNCL